MSLQNELSNLKDKYGDNVAFKLPNGDEYTYRKFYEDACYRAEMFYGYAEKRLAVIAGNSYEWLCHVYGALMVGMTVIVMDSLLPLDNLEVLLHNTDAEMVWTDVEDRKLRALVENKCRINMHVFTERQTESLDEDGIQWKDGELVFFTSGTTSMAKGVVLSVEASYTNCRNLSELLVIDVEGSVFAPLPLYHIYTYTLVFAFLCQGRTICLGSVRRMADELQHFRPEILVLVPSVADYLLDNGLLNDEVRAITVAGAKCEISLEKKAAEVGVRIQNLYGASEAAGTIALNLPGYGVDELVPAKGVEICWENENEIVLRTVSRMKEYYKNPEATKNVLKGDLLITGDIGQKNPNGTFSPLGRKEDVIAMKNGDKLYCNEVDEELSGLEGAKEACVLYVDGKIVAVSVADEENKGIAEKAIKAYNKKQPYFRKIEDIWVRTEPLPRTRIGKLKRKETEQQYMQRKTEKV